MKLVCKSILVGFTVLMSTSVFAAVVGLLGVDDNVTVSLEKKADNTIEFILQIKNNDQGLKYGFSPGNAFISHAVIEKEGAKLVILSIMEGTAQLSAQNLDVVDPTTSTTLQRTNLSTAILALEHMGYLVDKVGNRYQASDIEGVVFVYQYLSPGAFDTSLGAAEVMFDNLVAGGEVVNILGLRTKTTGIDLPSVRNSASVQAVLFEALEMAYAEDLASPYPMNFIKNLNQSYVVDDGTNKIICTSGSPGMLTVMEYSCSLTNAYLDWTMSSDSVQAVIFDALYEYRKADEASKFPSGYVKTDINGSLIVEDEAYKLTCESGSPGMLAVMQYKCALKSK